MKKILLAFSIVFILCFNSYAQEVIGTNLQSSLYLKVQNSTVSVRLDVGKNGVGFCSGVVLKNKSFDSVVITAKHCVDISQGMYVNNIPVKTIIASTKEDLALLIVDGYIPSKYNVKLAENNAVLGDKVYHYGLPKLQEYFIHGKVVMMLLSNHYASMVSIGGCSGGGIFNEKGELVGILWGGTQMLTIYTPISKINQFLEEVNYK